MHLPFVSYDGVVLKGLYWNFILPYSFCYYYNAGLSSCDIIEALSDPRGNVKAGTKVSYWMAYAHGISWCHSSCFSFPPGKWSVQQWRKCAGCHCHSNCCYHQGRCDGHGSIQTQNTFRGKVHELTCTHTSTTSLETITHISRPWHLQVQTRALDILARVKKLTITTVLHNTTVFILDLKGKVLISRNYRGDIPMSAVEKFMPLVCLFKRDDNKD